MILDSSGLLQVKSLLASDMDGTVIPYVTNKHRLAEIHSFKIIMEDAAELSLAYVTGRHLELGLAGVKKWGLPEPDIFVCDVGTTIYFKDDAGWHVDSDYREGLKKAWQGMTGQGIADILDEVDEITAQEDEKQMEFKQSYYASLDFSYMSIIERIKSRLAEQSIEANVIYSVDPKKNVGLVDVLPRNAAKDFALNYLYKKLDLDHERVVYAGDSGNDLLAFVSGFNSIIVNNATDAVKAETRRYAKKKGVEDKLFFASGNFVLGVIEGCRHFGLIG